MKTRVEVRSQAEFDACIKASNIAVVIGCSVVAWENSSVVARENSSVVAWGNSSVVARGNVFVRWFSALKIKASFAVIIGKMGEPDGALEGRRHHQGDRPDRRRQRRRQAGTGAGRRLQAGASGRGAGGGLPDRRLKNEGEEGRHIPCR